MTLDQLRAGYARNLVSLRECEQSAAHIAPRKYRGYALAEWREHVALFERLSRATDAELAEHLRGVQARCRDILSRGN